MHVLAGKKECPIAISVAPFRTNYTKQVGEGVNTDVSGALSYYVLMARGKPEAFGLYHAHRSIQEHEYSWEN